VQRDNQDEAKGYLHHPSDHDCEHWVVLLRPAQLTLGTLVLCCKGAATSFGEVSAAAFAEQKLAVADIEACMMGSPSFGAKKMNYLMLMMKDPQVPARPSLCSMRRADGR
jgi:diadenosine tetraphosphate (Ap4A) HIT family hydrolase